MEEKKEMSLIEKRARLLELKKEICWVRCEHSKSICEERNMVTHQFNCAFLHNYLLDLIKELKELNVELDTYYKIMVNELASDLKNSAYLEYKQRKSIKKNNIVL